MKFTPGQHMQIAAVTHRTSLKAKPNGKNWPPADSDVWHRTPAGLRTVILSRRDGS